MVNDSENSEVEKNAEIEKIIDGHIARLMEHFDTVQIMVTIYKNGDTISLERGSGNFFTRLGQAGSWVSRNDN